MRIQSSAKQAAVVALLAILVGPAASPAGPQDYFAIRVVDDQTGRGVPLAYLTTTYHQKYVTDSNGYVAFHEPGLMNGDDVWFEVESYGYEAPTGSVGVKGVALKPRAGASAEVRIKRTQVAERLYRTTGYGIYRDTVLLGKTPPVSTLLNAQVTGQDTVQTAVYRGKLYWMWQDTDRVGFGLGGFSMTGAVSALPDKLDLNKGINFTYFVDKPGGFAKPMAVVPRDGNQPIWVDGLTVVKDAAGRERMIGKYIAANKDFSAAESGLLLYNDAKDVMERLTKFDGTGKDVLSPGGHTTFIRDGGTRYAFYNGNLRVKADYDSVIDPAQYEGFTCLNADGRPDRKNGKLIWAWKRGAKPVDFDRARELIKAKLIESDESPYQFKDVDSGRTITPAGASVAWSGYLNCWTNVFCQKMGDSMLGEIWISFANSPEGPWTSCKKVATHAMKHNNNDLYNVYQHDELVPPDSRHIYFQGTFVRTFSGNPWPTPYYNYNNIMYRIDLADARLKLPTPPAGLTQTRPDNGDK